MIFVTYLDEKIRIMLTEAGIYDSEGVYVDQLPWTSPSWEGYKLVQEETGIILGGEYPLQGNLWK